MNANDLAVQRSVFSTLVGKLWDFGPCHKSIGKCAEAKIQASKNLKSIDLIHAVREPAPAHKDVRVLLFLISYGPCFPQSWVWRYLNTPWELNLVLSVWSAAALVSKWLIMFLYLSCEQTHHITSIIFVRRAQNGRAAVWKYRPAIVNATTLMGGRHLVGQKEMPTTIQVVSVNRYKWMDSPKMCSWW